MLFYHSFHIEHHPSLPIQTTTWGFANPLNKPMINMFKLCIVPKSQSQPFAGGNTLQKADVLWKTAQWGEAKPQCSLWRIHVQRARRETELFWARRAQAEKHAASGRKAPVASRSVCCAPWEAAGAWFSSWSVQPLEVFGYPQAV